MPKPPDLFYPLDQFYRRRQLQLPALDVLRGEDVPEPYRSLLVHDHDMTPTLSRYHGDTIGLRVLERYQEGDAYSRQVVLFGQKSQRPVEFGAIVIHLQYFPADARADILAGKVPLGTILAQHRVAHHGRPRAYFCVTSDDLINTALGLTEPRFLFGRRNVHLDPQEDVLADIVEILPPLP